MKKVIIGVDDNDDYLQFWDLQRKIWMKTDWELKIIFVGDKKIYDNLNKEGIESVYIERPDNIKTSYYIQTITHLSRILEDDDTILYYCDMDQILINKFKLLEDKKLKLLNENTLIHGSIRFDNTSYCKTKHNVEAFMSMHNIAYSKTWKKIYKHLNLNSLDDIINYTKKNYPENFAYRGKHWGIEQHLLRNSIKIWLKNDPKHNVINFSMNELKEGWLYRKASMVNQTFDLYDTVNRKIINNNIIDYIKNNNHITWLHPYLGSLFKGYEDVVNDKIKKEIILPLLEML